MYETIKDVAPGALAKLPSRLARDGNLTPKNRRAGSRLLDDNTEMIVMILSIEKYYDEVESDTTLVRVYVLYDTTIYWLLANVNTPLSRYMEILT